MVHKALLRFCTCLVICIIITSIIPQKASAAGTFTSAAIDAICDEYGFATGKYWSYNETSGSSTAYTASTHKATTYTSTQKGRPGEINWVGYRYANGSECWAFTAFIGAKLSGYSNPYSSWTKYTSIEAAGGLCVGDIIRTTGHSAMIYSIGSDGTIKTVECWGGHNNIIKLHGYYSGYSACKTWAGLVDKYNFEYLLRAKNNTNTPYMPNSASTKYPYTELFTRVQQGTLVNTIKLLKYPYSDCGVSVRTGEKGSVVTTKRAVLNSYGTIWYELSDGSFVTENLINFVGSAEGSSGTSADLTNYTVIRERDVALRVVSDCDSQQYPYADAENKKTYVFDDRVQALRIVQNSYGNLWYQLADGYFLNENQVQVLGATGDYFTYTILNEQPMTCNVKSGTVSKQYPYAACKNVATGLTTVNVVAAVENTYGNTWYKLADGSFLYSGDVLEQAAGALTITSSALNSDGYMEITVGIKNNPGFIGCGFELVYSDTFSLRSVTPICLLTGAVFTNEENRIAVMSPDVIDGDGDLFTVVLNHDESISFGFKVVCTGASNAVGNTIIIDEVSTVIDVPVANRFPGDADEDGKVDWPDVILALKKVCAWPVTLNESNADVTGDGIVDWPDVILLLKYVCSWPVTLI